MPKQLPRVVIVEWLDAHAHEDLVRPEDVDAELHRGYATVSAGILVKSDRKGVSMATDRQDGPNGETHYSAATFIPRGMIVKERVLGGRAKPRKR